MVPPRIALVRTGGGGSLDLYAQRLSERLGVATLGANGVPPRRFNVPIISRSAARLAVEDARFVRALRSTETPLHLPNQHLGRYGRFLSTPYLLTVHDLIRYFDGKLAGALIHRPNNRDRVLLNADIVGARRAAAVIAVSATTKRDLVCHLGLDEHRVHVVHNGVDHKTFRPVLEAGYEFPYVLFVGSEHPRKNLLGLLRAFSHLVRERAFADLRLVKVGAAGGGEAPFRERTLRAIDELGLRHRVVLTGRIPDDRLAGLYSGASCFVLPSLYEGFGLPPLEAMACGCPVVVSRAGALPEVVADAGLIVESPGAGALARAMREALSPATAAELRRRGLRRASGFSWERTARETSAVYRLALGEETATRLERAA